MSALRSDVACISDYQLDRWFARELSAAQERDLNAHLYDCAHCSLRCDELDRQRIAFHRRSPDWQSLAARYASGAVVESAPVRGARHKLGQHGVHLAALSAAVACVTMLVLRDSAHVPWVAPSKGAPSIGFYVEHRKSGEQVRAGELVRFHYSAERPSYFALLHADTSRASIYFPASGQARLVAAGREVLLDFATRFEPAHGPERVYGLFCEHGVALEPLRERLETTGELPPTIGCQVARAVLHEERE